MKHSLRPSHRHHFQARPTAARKKRVLTAAGVKAPEALLPGHHQLIVVSPHCASN